MESYLMKTDNDFLGLPPVVIVMLFCHTLNLKEYEKQFRLV